MFTNADCTVFNKRFDRETRTDVWYKTYISGVYWESSNGVTTNSTTKTTQDDSLFMAVPANADTEPFPDSITADGREYKIVTDFRDWIQFADMISDITIPKEERIGLMGQWLISPPEYITGEIVGALSQFYAASELEYVRRSDNEDNQETESIRRPPVFDWRIDARYVLGDFRRFYKIDLTETSYMHWWKFLSLFAALPDESSCHKRMIYRGTNPAEIKSDSERERVRKIQRQIALPFEYSDEDIGDIFGGVM